MSKVVSKIAVIGVGVAMLAGAGFALRQNSAPAARAHAADAGPNSIELNSIALTRSSDLTRVPTSGDAPGATYQPSKFPGVQVRHVPAPATASASAQGAQGAWIGKRPGTARPREGIQMPQVAARAPVQGLRTGQGTTKYGGTWVAVPPSRVPLSTGRRNQQKNGERKAVVNCLEPHNHATHSSH